MPNGRRTPQGVNSGEHARIASYRRSTSTSEILNVQVSARTRRHQTGAVQVTACTQGHGYATAHWPRRTHDSFGSHRPIDCFDPYPSHRKINGPRKMYFAACESSSTSKSSRPRRIPSPPDPTPLTASRTRQLRNSSPVSVFDVAPTTKVMICSYDL